MKSRLQKNLIIDIRSVSVGAGLFSVSKEKDLEISEVRRVFFKKGSSISPDHSFELLASTLKNLAQLYRERYESIRVVVAAPWYESEVKTISSHSEKPVRISEETVESVIKNYQESVTVPEGFERVESVALSIEANGYLTRLFNPVFAETLRIHFYQGYIEKKFFNKIADIIDAHLPHTPLSFHTFPPIAMTGMYLISDEPSFFLVDVGGEMSDILLAHRHTLPFTARIEEGYLSLLTEASNSSSADKKARFHLLVKGELSEGEAEKAREELQESFKGWRHKLEESVKGASEKTPLPRTVFLLCDKEQSAWLKYLFQIEPVKHINPVVVTPPLLQKRISVGENGVFDVCICLAALFFHTGVDSLIGEPTPRKRK